MRRMKRSRIAKKEQTCVVCSETFHSYKDRATCGKPKCILKAATKDRCSVTVSITTVDPSTVRTGVLITKLQRLTGDRLVSAANDILAFRSVVMGTGLSTIAEIDDFLHPGVYKEKRK